MDTTNIIIKWLLISCITMPLAAISAPAQEYTELDCLVKPEMYVDISSPVDGVLASVLVNKGDIVNKGQTLALLESSVEAAQLQLAKQEVQMDNIINGKRARYEYTQRKSERYGNLNKLKSISKDEYDEAVTDAYLAKSEFTQAKLDKKANEMKLLLAKAVLEQKTIKSPIDGIVVERYLVPGESTENKPIVQLAKIDPLLVEVVAPSTMFGKIKKNMTAEIRPDSPANSQYSASVFIVDRIIDAASSSFSVRLELPNPDSELIGGTKCSARFAIKLPDAQTSKSADEEIPDDIKSLLKH